MDEKCGGEHSEKHTVVIQEIELLQWSLWQFYL